VRGQECLGREQGVQAAVEAGVFQAVLSHQDEQAVQREHRGERVLRVQGVRQEVRQQHRL
jgi:hypothetical protein